MASVLNEGIIDWLERPETPTVDSCAILKLRLTEALDQRDHDVIQMALSNINEAHESESYGAEVRASIKRGLEDVLARRPYTHEQVKRHFDIEE